MRKALKITLYTLGSILLLLSLVIVWLNTRWGQEFVRSRAEAYLAGKLKTEVRIGELGYGLPKYVVLNNILLKDQAKDTVISIGHLKVDVNMLQLLHKKLDVEQLVLQDMHAHVYRNMPDTTFNFSYIINAFTGPVDPNRKKDTAKKSSSFKVAVSGLKLDNINLRFDDATGGMRFALGLQHLSLAMKDIDLDKMKFHVKDLAVSGLQTSYAQDTSYLPPKPKDTGKADLLLVADNVDLQNIAFGYSDNLNKLLFDLNLGKLNLQVENFNLRQNLVLVKKLDLQRTSSSLVFGKHSTPPAPIDTIIKKDTTEGWNLKANDVNIAGVSFKMDNENVARQPKGMDYAHLNIRDLFMQLRDFGYTSDSMSGDLQKLTVNEQCGLDVKELRTKFNYNQHGAVLTGLYLQTANTILQHYFEVHYPSLAKVKDSLQTITVKVDVDSSVVAMSDVLLFAPMLEAQDIFRKSRNSRVKLAARIEGPLSELEIARLYASGFTNTEIDIKGRMSGLPDASALRYSLSIARFRSSRGDVELFVADSVLQQVRIPDVFSAHGTVSGSIKDYTTDIALTSTDGDAAVKGTLAMSPGAGRERYDLSVKTLLLNIGHIIRKDTLLGKVSADLVVKGQSFDIKTMTADMTGNIAKAEVKGYSYHDVKMQGKVAGKIGDVKLSSADSNARLQLDGHADFNGQYMAVRTDINIDSIDFRALKLYPTELRASGLMHADFPELNPDYPKGIFVWRQPVVNANNVRYYLDSLYVISKSSTDSGQNIAVNMDIMQANITGRTPLTKIGAIVQEHINRHYTFPKTDSLRKVQADKKADSLAMAGVTTSTIDTTLPREYDLDIKAHVVDKPMLHSILPGLKSFDSIHIDAGLTPQLLTLDVAVPNVQYNTATVANASIKVFGVDSAFTYHVTADKLSQGKFALYYANIHGDLDKDVVTTSISLSDSVKKERFLLAANMTKVVDSQIIRLSPGLKLDYKEWTVAEPNNIVLASNGWYVHNFSISNGGQVISANSDGGVNTPLKVAINNFQLSNITNAISEHDTLLADGTLNANVVLEKFEPSPLMAGDAEIKKLVVLRDTLGDLKAQFDNKQDKTITTRLTLQGYGNDIALNGAYYTQTRSGNDFDFNMDVTALSLHSFETIAGNQVRNSSGLVRGKLTIKGTAAAPRLDGELRTDNLVTTVSQLNATFKMPSERITFTGQGMELHNFTILDSAGNKATFDGSVDFSKLSSIGYDMSVDARNWRAVHSTKKDNKEYFGDLYVTANLKLKGSPVYTNVDGNINILKGTNLTIVTPESTPSIESRDGIVVFRNLSDTSRRNVLAPRRDTTHRRRYSSSDINVNVSVDKAARFSLIIDQASGDFLSVRGDAALNASITKGGTFGLTGTYALHDGTYQFNYNFIKRKFTIQDGSIITFAGDPVDGATMDITAAYETQAPAYDLVQRQVPDQAQLNYYKQRIPFDVLLRMKGKLLKPGLSFDVQLPDNKIYPLSSAQIDLIQSKLTQIRTDTSELNKQVFALLILNRFVSDDPFQSGASTSAKMTALQSVSTFVGEQLNQAAGKFVKGVDFSVDLATTEDYTTGDMRQRTDLNVSASKQLANDRLKLTVGNNFELEGPQTNTDQKSYVPTNLAADYLLSADGKYTVRAYRRAYDEGVLQGFVTETGLNFIVSLDYNKFKKRIQKEKERRDADIYYKPQAQP